ncbi:hypothetical protein Tco_1215812 [Tanacetum coccineum]
MVAVPRRQENHEEVLLLRLGLRECLNSPMNHLSYKVTTSGEVGREREGCTSCGNPQTKVKSQEIRKKEEVKHFTPKKEDIQADSDFDNLDDLVDEGMAFVQEKDAENQGVSTAGEGVSTAASMDILLQHNSL